MAELIEALQNEQLRTAWMKKHFEVPPYPADASHKAMIEDLITQKTNPVRQYSYFWQWFQQ